MQRIKTIHFKKISSTQKIIRYFLNFSPVVVVADEQTKGMGRLGRSWFSPKGGLWFSFAFKFKNIKNILPFLVPLTIIETLKKFANLEYRILIPNDIYVKNKKLSGILIEKTKDDYFIIGIGINTNNTSFPDNLKEQAISLKNLTGNNYDNQKILKTFLGIFFSKISKSEERNFIKKFNNYVIKDKLKITLKNREKLVCNIKEIKPNLRIITKNGLEININTIEKIRLL